MYFCVVPVSEPDTDNVDRDWYSLPRKKYVSDYFTDISRAEAAAKKAAQEHPNRQFAVMGTLAVYETTTPKVIKKVITESGELVLEK